MRAAAVGQDPWLVLRPGRREGAHAERIALEALVRGLEVAEGVRQQALADRFADKTAEIVIDTLVAAGVLVRKGPGG